MGQTSQDRLRQYQQRKARTIHVTRAAWLAEHHDVPDCAMQRRISVGRRGTSVAKLEARLRKRKCPAGRKSTTGHEK